MNLVHADQERNIRNAMVKHKLNLMFLDYDKIFRIINGVAAYANKGAPPSCLFYNVTGALILSSIYKIDARPVLGAAFIKVNTDTDFALAFADSDYESCSSNINGFHCWIETPTHIIDFTAPIYSEYPNLTQLPKLMFQKHKSEMSNSHFELDSAGDFFFKPNIPLTIDRLKAGFQDTKFNDFAQIALDWSKNSTKKLLNQMKIQADDGEVIELNASKINLTGSW